MNEYGNSLWSYILFNRKGSVYKGIKLKQGWIF